MCSRDLRLLAPPDLAACARSTAEFWQPVAARCALVGVESPGPQRDGATLPAARRGWRRLPPGNVCEFRRRDARTEPAHAILPRGLHLSSTEPSLSALRRREHRVPLLAGAGGPLDHPVAVQRRAQASTEPGKAASHVDTNSCSPCSGCSPATPSLTWFPSSHSLGSESLLDHLVHVDSFLSGRSIPRVVRSSLSCRPAQGFALAGSPSALSDAFKKAVTTYRSEIASLTRRTKDLEDQLRRLGKGSTKAKAADAETMTRAPRFSAKALASQRRRLNLSAERLGLLIGVSGQSVYNWGKAPRPPMRSTCPPLQPSKA